MDFYFCVLEFIALRYYFRNSPMRCHDRLGTFDSTVEEKEWKNDKKKQKTKENIIIKAPSCYQRDDYRVQARIGFS